MQLELAHDLVTAQSLDLIEYKVNISGLESVKVITINIW